MRTSFCCPWSGNARYYSDILSKKKDDKTRKALQKTRFFVAWLLLSEPSSDNEMPICVRTESSMSICRYVSAAGHAFFCVLFLTDLVQTHIQRQAENLVPVVACAVSKKILQKHTHMRHKSLFHEASAHYEHLSSLCFLQCLHVYCAPYIYMYIYRHSVYKCQSCCGQAFVICNMATHGITQSSLPKKSIEDWKGDDKSRKALQKTWFFVACLLLSEPSS